MNSHSLKQPPIQKRANSVAHEKGGRQKKKMKQEKAKQQRTVGSSGSSCHVQVLGLGADVNDTVPSLLLFTETRRYVFNCGEGFQRYCGEHKVKLAKMGPIMLTRVGVDACGGFPGLCLSMSDNSENRYGSDADAKAPSAIMGARSNVTLCGPAGTRALVRYAKSFVGSGKLEIIYQEMPGAPRAAAAAEGGVPLTVDGAEDGKAAHIALKDENLTILASVLSPSPEGGGLDANSAKASCVYYVKLNDTPGKFDPVKATALGIPNGPARAKLVRGESVTLEDGKTVHPHECVGPSRLGARVMIVDCPTQGHVVELQKMRMDQFEIDSETGTSTGRMEVAAVFHVTPASVMKSEAYVRWMRESFGGADTKHIACCIDRADIQLENIQSAAEASVSIASASDPIDIDSVFCSSSRMQAKLNILDGGIFPLHMGGLGSAGGGAAPVLPEGVMHGKNLLRFHLRPEAIAGIDSTAVPPRVSPSSVQSDVRNDVSDIGSLLEAMKLKYAKYYSDVDSESGEVLRTDASIPQALRTLRRGEAQILFLGTGAAAPSKYRNVSGLYLSTTMENDGMIMDCGEGTLGQLRRRFGVEGANERIKRLKLIWISHIHADHHVGLPSLLLARKRLLSKEGTMCPPITVIGPKPLRYALSILDQHFDLRMSFIDCWDTREGVSAAPPSSKSEVLPALQALGIGELKSVDVVHCSHAFACQIQHSKGWKFVYSADTRPCQQIIDASKDATLLVHEATFEDELIHEALARRHSIIREAVEVGAKAGAYRTLLTHFSQRYPKIPDLHGSYMDERTCIAFDMMHVDFLDLPKLPLLMAPLSALFRDLEQEDGDAVDGDAVE